MVPLHLFVASFLGWLQWEQHKVVEYLREENRVLKAQLRSQRVQLTDDERRRLAVLGVSLGRRILAEVATIVTPDTILRWHRELIARKWTYRKRRLGRPAVLPTIRSWGYTRIQGALKNLGHRVARSTIATILKEQGIPPSVRVIRTPFSRAELQCACGAVYTPSQRGVPESRDSSR